MTMPTGSTIISMTIPGIEAILKLGVVECFQSDTNQQLGYNAKLLVLMRVDCISIAIILTKGRHDKHLPWPFKKNVVFILVNEDDTKNRERGFRCDINGMNFADCLSKPIYGSNLPLGIAHFIPKQALKNGFIKKNCIHVKGIVFPQEIKLSNDTNMELPSVIDVSSVIT